MKSGSRLAAWTYQGRDLQRGAAEESLKVAVLNELRSSRGKSSPETSWLARQAPAASRDLPLGPASPTTLAGSCSCVLPPRQGLVPPFR